jgi:cytochrome c biogenesis protein CcmG/thiol:disulfide interchange protein DsbE
MNYQILLGNNDVAVRYGGVKGIPTTFVIDRTGKIAAKFVGFRTKEIFESEIKKLL